MSSLEDSLRSVARQNQTVASELVDLQAANESLLNERNKKKKALQEKREERLDSQSSGNQLESRLSKLTLENENCSLSLRSSQSAISEMESEIDKIEGEAMLRIKSFAGDYVSLYLSCTHFSMQSSLRLEVLRAQEIKLCTLSGELMASEETEKELIYEAEKKREELKKGEDNLDDLLEEITERSRRVRKCLTRRGSLRRIVSKRRERLAAMEE